MDSERIDALLMDHALGGTGGDVAALIEAYVEKDVEARGRLDGFRATVGLAKRAVAVKAVVLPTFPREALERSRQGMGWRRGVLWGGGIAACVAVGFMMGSGWRATAPSIPVIAQMGAGEGATSSSPPAPERVAAVKDFWSMSRLRANAESAPKPSGAGTVWWNGFQRSLRVGG